MRYMNKKYGGAFINATNKDVKIEFKMLQSSTLHSESSNTDNEDIMEKINVKNGIGRSFFVRCFFDAFGLRQAWAERVVFIEETVHLGFTIDMMNHC